MRTTTAFSAAKRSVREQYPASLAVSAVRALAASEAGRTARADRMALGLRLEFPAATYPQKVAGPMYSSTGALGTMTLGR